MLNYKQQKQVEKDLKADSFDLDYGLLYKHNSKFNNDKVKLTKDHYNLNNKKMIPQNLNIIILTKNY